ncbi:MAG: phosphatidylserine/phosphatidylglycerophosphate/cardiolipin synthase family protein [Candidatus Omnitrophica bacterium]|nr:phosphatidylserine/phosphatidylglycerophosphate/cardiolipin synthase family protein [Candidatus Omnitrophota bacterium]
MKTRILKYWTISVLWGLLFFAGCASLDGVSPFKKDQVARVWLDQNAAIDVQEAFSGPVQLYIKFRVIQKDSLQAKVFYGCARWPGKQKEISVKSDQRIRFIGAKEYTTSIQGLNPVDKIGEQEWRAIRLAVAHRITPRHGNFGVSIINEQEQLFLYYSEDQELMIVDLTNKPAGFITKRSFFESEIMTLTMGALDEYLKLQDTGSGRVLLTLSRQEDTTKPFLYIDLHKGKAFRLNIFDDQDKPARESLIDKGFKTADYLIFSSHVLGLIKRPVSSSLRLVSWSRDTAYDLLDPQSRVLLEKNERPALNQGAGMDLDEWEERLDRLAGIDSRSVGQIDFLIGGDAFFTRFLKVLEQARQSIYLRLFIFDNDDFGVHVADLLKEKARDQDVSVKVLLDGMGQVMGEGKVPDDIPADFTPPGSIYKYLQSEKKLNVRLRPSVWFRADHVKTFIMDKEICFMGGMNIGREYRYDWHDMMMEVRGPVVANILKDYRVAWYHSGPLGDLGYVKSFFQAPIRPTEQLQTHYPLRLLFTRLNEPQIFRSQVEAIRRARKYIYIHNAYFSDDTILMELVKARRRGVDVRVILPYHGNHQIMNASNVHTANIMFRNGIRVYFYPKMSHIKAAVYDGWLCAGSANFDRLSFRENLEMNIATSHKPVVDKILGELFDPDFKRSIEMKEPLKSGVKELIAEFLAEQL